MGGTRKGRLRPWCKGVPAFRPFSRKQGRDGTNANLARIFVRNLSRKLGDDAANPTWIFTERGVGYPRHNSQLVA